MLNISGQNPSHWGWSQVSFNLHYAGDVEHDHNLKQRKSSRLFQSAVLPNRMGAVLGQVLAILHQPEALHILVMSRSGIRSTQVKVSCSGSVTGSHEGDASVFSHHRYRSTYVAPCAFSCSSSLSFLLHIHQVSGQVSLKQ